MSTCKLAIGTTLLSGKYRIESILGQGGFGITYLASHTILDRKVAIKEFFPKEYCDRDDQTSHITIGTKNNTEIVDQLRNKFIKEAKNISKLDHPNIIKIQDVFEENNTAYYVMEYIDGESLEEIVSKQGPLSGKTAFRYMEQIASALNYMHTSRHLLHLDVKPANIMVRNEDSCPILIDFGLSKAYSDSGGQTSTTPHGMSPGYSPMEQYNLDGVSEFTPQTDIYSLGATFYKLIAGEAPAPAPKRVENQALSFPPSLNQTLCDLITHCMQMVKRRRPADMGTVLDIMANCRTEDEVIPVQVTPDEVPAGRPTKVIGKGGGNFHDGVPAAPRKGMPSAVKYVLLALGVALAAGVISYFALSGKKSDSVDTAPIMDSEIAIVNEEVPSDSISHADAGLAVETPAPDDNAGKPAAEPKKQEADAKKAMTPAPQPKEAKKDDAGTRQGAQATTTNAPATSGAAAVKIAAQSISAANMESGMRVTGASISGNALVFHVSCNTSVYDAEDCRASNPIFRQAIKAYMSSSSTAAAAAKVAMQQRMHVKFAFSGANSFTINY